MKRGRNAAVSGLDVRIIIPGNPDHLFVYWASMSYLGELLEAGVRCPAGNDLCFDALKLLFFGEIMLFQRNAAFFGGKVPASRRRRAYRSIPAPLHCPPELPQPPQALQFPEFK